jgi:hypothetical protein
MIFRCPCKAFQGKGKRYKKIIRNSFIDYTKKFLTEEEAQKIEGVNECIIIFLEPGGSYDEYYFLLTSSKLIKKRITVYFVDEESEKHSIKNAFRYIQKIYSQNKASKISIETVSLSTIKKIITHIHKTLIYLFALDEYYFLYETLFTSKEDFTLLTNHDNYFFLVRLHSINHFLSTHRLILCARVKSTKNIIKKEYIGTKKKIHSVCYKNSGIYR